MFVQYQDQVDPQQASRNQRQHWKVSKMRNLGTLVSRATLFRLFVNTHSLILASILHHSPWNDGILMSLELIKYVGF